MMAYGAVFGVTAVAVRRSARNQVRRRAAEIEVAEPQSTEVAPYLTSVPRSIMSKQMLDAVMSEVPKEQWENPPEDSYLYTLKMYAETYGEGKATKMAWWDYYYMRSGQPSFNSLYTTEVQEASDAELKSFLAGRWPISFPAPPFAYETGTALKWSGRERFAGDQVVTAVNNSKFSVAWVSNMAFYRKGLEPWQRGLEIGIAHGYFLIGPFINFGPLRDTPEATLIGLLSGAGVIGFASIFGLIFGTIVKPKQFDRPQEPSGSGFIEMINWHAVGGLGGAGLAHALLTLTS